MSSPPNEENQRNNINNIVEKKDAIVQKEDASEDVIIQDDHSNQLLSYKSSSHCFDAHLPSTNLINKDLAAPSIDQIIEEEEDEENYNAEDVAKNENVSNSVNTELENMLSNNSNKIITTLSKISNIATPTTITTHETTKFVLEPVVLTNTNSIVQSNSTNNQQTDVNLTLVDTLGEEKEDKDKDNSSEVTEIKVEEGYATRQMDEYFRQTIAAIKEELTKKLENNTPNNNDVNQNQNNNDQDNYSNYDDTSTSDYYYYEDDMDDENNNQSDNNNNETTLNETNNDIELGNNANQTTCDLISTQQHASRFNRNLLYQYILMFNKKESTKYDKINCWLVILGCFLNHFIIDGLCYNYANLFDLIQIEFKQSSKLISSMPFTLLIGFYLLIAPLSLYLTKIYGSRRIALIGTFISSVSLLISSYLKENIILFILFYGIFTGTGLSFIYVPSLITSSKWFLKKRLFANSITILGACFGSAMYPLFSELILRKYDLFDSIFILSGVQLNCLIGAILLRDHKHTVLLSTHATTMINNSLSRKSDNKINRNHAKKVNVANNINKCLDIANKNTNNNDSIEMKVTKEPVANRINKRISKINEHGKIGKSYRKKNFLLGKNNNTNTSNGIDDYSETESTTSASTSTVPNYTLKQYWRKFVQTRKSQNNAKKNLFHLIAEEKRKTRTLSKTSLEDGFVITTSNNLLAPNDESHVIISRQEKIRQHHQSSSVTPTVHSSSSRVAASRFFTRIANSLRSLAHSSSQSQQQQHPHPQQHQQTSNASSPTTTTHHSKNQLHQLYDINEASSKSNTVHSQQTPPPTIPLMSVFNNPLNDIITNTNSTSTASQQQNNNNDNNIVFDDFNISSFCDGDDSHHENDDELSDEDKIAKTKTLKSSSVPTTTPTNPHRIINTSNDKKTKKLIKPAQMSRYLNYRNSLTNSVRGSLLEVSVPEDKEGDDDQKNLSIQNDDDDLFYPKSKSPSSQRVRRNINNTNKRLISNNQYNRMRNGRKTNNDNNNRNKYQLNDAGFVIPSLLNIRRYISIIDGFSFYNVPFNLESIEFNLRNSLIKKCSDKYRKIHRNNINSTFNRNYFKLFLEYFIYLISFQLLKNRILLMLNISFFFSIIGMCVPLVYICEYSLKLDPTLTKLQSIILLSLIGLMTGLGRILSTIVYKVNKSNAKNRIFSYELTMILAGLTLISFVFICDTFFSLSMFSITYGILIGFNLNLRSFLIYDIIGLEWSDDSLCFNVILFQAIGALIGIPISGLIYDLTKNYSYVFYFASSSLLLSALILTPGRKIKDYAYASFKSINKYYLQKRVPN